MISTSSKSNKTTSSEKKFCKHCGEELLSGVSVCEKCGGEI